jgi:hypothetical protein
VEHLLNLLWLLVVSALFALTLRSHVSGRLRCSLPVALGCVALIALTLFPALSMTDDLQRAKLYAETNGHHDSLLLRSMEDGEHLTTFSLISSFLLMIAASLIAAGTIARRREVLASPQTRGLRPRAVRPPPVFALTSAL